MRVKTSPSGEDTFACQDRGDVRVQEIETGLWRWTGLHPAWTPADGGPDGWEQEVGCVFYEAPEAVVLVDPLVPMEDRERFFEALDRDVERLGRPVRVLLTVDDHRRSSAELAERYDGTIGVLPAGVDVALDAWDERVYWIPEHRSLVFGDVLLERDGRLELPRSWIGDENYDATAEALRPLLELPVERVLVAHGEPVLEDGQAALAAALAPTKGPGTG
jgi:glyoxylase-like metal-dependent hydrolase (beta-lactamase superfamily II)